MKINFLLGSIGFLLLLGFVAFIPTGPYPIYITTGLRLDVLFGLLLITSIIFYLPRIKSYPNYFIGSWIFYLLVVFVSATFSVDIEHSLRNAIVMLGYSMITMLIPVLYSDRADNIRRWLFLVAILVSVLILYMHLFLGYGYEHRFALGMEDLDKRHARLLGIATVDPNMTAAGLLLSLIVFLPNIFDNRRRFILDVLGVMCILAASLVTLSRSALLGFVLAISLSFLMVSIKSLKINDILRMNREKLISLLVLIVIITGFVFLLNLVFPETVDRLLRRMSGDTDDSVRIDMLVGAWNVFMTDAKTIVIGSGYMTSNPHNEYMRTLSTMGLLGVLASVWFFGSMIYISIKELSRKYRMMFSALSIIVFVIVISTFYGYTKLIWVAWMFLLLLYCESRIRLDDSSNLKL